MKRTPIRKIAVLGSTGLLGQALMFTARSRGLQVVGAARKNADVALDVCDDAGLAKFCREGGFDAVVNCCAFVNHAYCDQHPGDAYRLNARPNALLSELAKECGFKLVYVSTDGYFNGDGRMRHDESAPVSFFNEYARTKWLGERFALNNSDALVVRTNIVGYRGRVGEPTFFEWVLDSLRTGKQMTLFSDYFTSSMSTRQFSAVLLDLLEKNASGLFNLASHEVSSKQDFIECASRTFDLPLVNPIVGSVRSLTASRRADSLGLNVNKVESVVGYAMPTLEEVMAQLRSEFVERK